jgi:hypothetical protein
MSGVLGGYPMTHLDLSNNELGNSAGQAAILAYCHHSVSSTAAYTGITCFGADLGPLARARLRMLDLRAARIRQTY